jgi:competence protein ComEA
MSRFLSARRSPGLALILACTLAAVLGAGTIQAADPRPVDLNTATVEQLQTLPRIGPAVAQRIVEYREKNGPFRRTAELMNVKGIGEKTFEGLKDLVIVAAEKSK